MAAGGGQAEANELRTLRRELALARQENDILKKAAIILGSKAQANCGR
jgi:transposase-like protein